MAHSSQVEVPPDHGRGRENLPFVGRQAIEPRGEERRDRRRYRDAGEIRGGRPTAVALDELAVVNQHGEDLLDEERIPLGGVGDPALDILRYRRRTEEI